MAKGESRLRRCAIYTRKSSKEGLEQDFNSLDAQRDACEAYIQSQAGEGWKLVRTRYDDGGYSGGTLDRPGLTRLLEDIDAGKIDTVVVYKVDRLTRSLGDFAKIVEIFDAREASFVLGNFETSLLHSSIAASHFFWATSICPIRSRISGLRSSSGYLARNSRNSRRAASYCFASILPAATILPYHVEVAA